MTDAPNPFGFYKTGTARARILKAAQNMPVSWLGRRGALILRKIFLLSGGGAVDAVVDGLKFRFYMDDNVSERKFLFMPQFFDKFERDLLKQTLKEGDAFVDLGANAGIYAMTAAALVGETGRVLAIEPNPAVMARLSFNAELNGFEKRIIAEQSGISDRAGSFELVLDESNLGGSSLVAARSDKSISVPCRLLLDLLRERGFDKIRAMKVDIEGAEDRALVPFFKEALAEMHPQLLILENSRKDWRLDLPGTLEKAGYHLLRTTRMNLVWEKA